MGTTVIGNIHALQQMSVAELREEWFRLYGEPARSRHREFLWKRLAWRVQELAHGGLSEGAQARIEELVPDALTFDRTPTAAIHVAAGEAGTTPSTKPRTVRDPRLPSPGTILTRQYHGHEIRVLTLEDGFEWDGQHYGSLSAVARAVTGQKWNGLLFFGITKRKRNS